MGLLSSLSSNMAVPGGFHKLCIPETRRGWLALLWLVLGAFPAHAAQVDLDAAAAAGQRPDPAALQAAPVPLDRAIDPATYRLGPGDQLTLSAGGISDWHQVVFVSPEGTIRVPN